MKNTPSRPPALPPAFSRFGPGFDPPPRNAGGAAVAIGMLLFVAVLGSVLALRQPFLGAGMLYVCVFLAIAWRFPAVALALSFAATPFQQDLAGGGPIKFSLGEFNMTLTFLVVLFQNVVQRRRFRAGPMLIPSSIYLAVCFFASYRAGMGKEDIVALAQMTLYLFATVLLFANAPVRLRQFRWCLYSIVGVVTLLAALSVLTSANAMFGLNKNGIGASEAVAFVICLELWFTARAIEERRLLFLALIFLVGGLIFSLSRGAWLCALTGFLTLVALRRQFLLLARASLVLFPLLALFWLFVPAEKQEYALSFDARRYNIQARLHTIEFARSQWEKEPLLGVGVGLRKQMDATNLIWTSLAETGVVGLISLLAIHAVFFGMVVKARRRIEPTNADFSLLAVAAALVLGRFMHGLVDHYWSRGVLLIAWASVGIATRLSLESSARPQREFVFHPGKEGAWKRR